MSEMDKDMLKDNKSDKEVSNKKTKTQTKNSQLKKTKNKNSEITKKVNTNTSNKSSKKAQTSNDSKKEISNVNKESTTKQTKNKKRSKKRSNRSKTSTIRNNEPINTKTANNSKTTLNSKKEQAQTKDKKINSKISDNKNIKGKSKTSSKDNKKKKNNKIKNITRNIIIIILLSLIVLLLILIFQKKNYEQEQKKYQEQIQEEIKRHYNEYVMTNKDAKIYKLNNNDRYVKAGTIAANQELTLDTEKASFEDEYFKISSFEEEYYIHYKDIDIIEELSMLDSRYKKYILFNQNIITEDKTSFYDEEGNLVYKFNSSFELPIIVNKKDLYGVELNNRLLYVKSEDVSKIEENLNTRLTNTKGIAVLNYHFFYDDAIASEKADCNQIICHSKSGFIKHLEYIKNNNIFTPTMNEFEMYLNKEINLPKSVLITIDDGWRTEIATKLLEKYELNATIFLITSWFEEINFLHDLKYVEYHSHGDNIHNQGDCPGGQGGAIKCLEKNKLLKDLNLSRQKLEGTTAFCYPFYEYNDYSISVLKEAGFTLAFAGGQTKATINTNKYQIPRYVMYDSTTVNQLRNYID